MATEREEDLPPVDFDKENYKAHLKKYTWHMEIPGDPLHIKRKVWPRRLHFYWQSDALDPNSVLNTEPEIVQNREAIYEKVVRKPPRPCHIIYPTFISENNPPPKLLPRPKQARYMNKSFPY